MLYACKHPQLIMYVVLVFRSSTTSIQLLDDPVVVCLDLVLVQPGHEVGLAGTGAPLPPPLAEAVDVPAQLAQQHVHDDGAEELVGEAVDAIPKGEVL